MKMISAWSNMRKNLPLFSINTFQTCAALRMRSRTRSNKFGEKSETVMKNVLNRFKMCSLSTKKTLNSFWPAINNKAKFWRQILSKMNLNLSFNLPKLSKSFY